MFVLLRAKFPFILHVHISHLHNMEQINVDKKNTPLYYILRLVLGLSMLAII